VTLRLQAARPWELPFVSVIDARGDRRKRSYFTKWHEVAHLLLLTNDRRMSFHRTHMSGTEQDPEEALVDLVAGRCGFHRGVVVPHVRGEISFSEIERLRLRLCPESSIQAARLGFAGVWPSPSVLLECKLAVGHSGQSAEPVLRATSVRANEAAERIAMRILRFSFR